MCSKLLDHCTAIVCSIKVAREFSLRFLAYIWSWAHPCISSIDRSGLKTIGQWKACYCMGNCTGGQQSIERLRTLGCVTIAPCTPGRSSCGVGTLMKTTCIISSCFVRLSPHELFLSLCRPNIRLCFGSICAMLQHEKW